MTGLNIRDARAGDQAAIQDVTISAYLEYAPIMQDNWERYRHSILGTLADVKPATQIVAEKGGAIVGTVLLFPAGTAFEVPSGESVSLPSPEVRLLAVSPAPPRQRVGPA